MKAQLVCVVHMGFSLSSQVVLFIFQIWTQLRTNWNVRQQLVLSITVCSSMAESSGAILTFLPIFLLVRQTPCKLFSTPHPEHYSHGINTLPIGTLNGIEEDAHLSLVQEGRCLKGVVFSLSNSSYMLTHRSEDLGPTVPVHELVLDMIGEKKISMSGSSVFHHPHEQVKWGSSWMGGM